MRDGEPNTVKPLKDIAVVIVAGGHGSRFGADLPKQYHQLGPKAVIAHTVQSFLDGGIEGENLQVVIAENMAEMAANTLKNIDVPAPVFGGTDRQASVLAGLEALAPKAPKYVLIHDAARPFVSPEVLGRIATALEKHPAIITALPVTDALQHAPNGAIEEPIDRTDMWRAQTPQAFDFNKILGAHRAHKGAALADDAAVAIEAGLPVHIVPGDERMFKITHAEDMTRAMAELTLQLPDIRTGFGYDVHAFEPAPGYDTHVTLCGVNVPHSCQLKGHSDADVAMHAITDAILGAISAGDIGTHFPPSEEKWKGAPSDIFLAHACKLVAARGGMINNLDVTIICEAPKIGPHREAMQTRLAEITGVEAERISVKATTTEKLGFTGRREGMAAQAVATVRLPLKETAGETAQ